MTFLYYDFESRSPTPIRWGIDNYFLSARPLLLTWAVDDGPVQIHDFTKGALPVRLTTAYPDAIWVAHNNQFDRRVMERLLGAQLPIERFRCTQAQAYAHGLPGSLETLGEVLGTKHRKRTGDDGHKLMMFFCVPRSVNKDGSPNWNEPHDFPDKWEAFKGYAIDDTETLRDVHRKLPTHNFQGINLETWFLDQRINERGFGFDASLAQAATRLLETAKGRQKRLTTVTTGGEVTSVTQRDKLLEWLNRSGLEIAGMKASDIREALDSDELDPVHRFLLELRLEGSKSSGAKYRRGLECQGPDGRLRDTMLYCGANRTGRWSGRNYQPQNLPRPSARWEDLDKENPWKPIEQIAMPAVLLGNQPVLDQYGGTNSVCNDILRSVIVAAPGCEFISADWANIESRFLAWCTGNEWKLDYFRRVDRGEAADSYKTLWAMFFNMRIEDVTKTMRQAAKRLDLACIAEDTMVLTDSGYVAIQDITSAHRVWDGFEWVKHAGTVAKGVRPVVSVDGISATPDHHFNCNGSWQEASTIVSSGNLLARALETGSENLPWSAAAKGTTPLAGSYPSPVLAEPGLMMFHGATSAPDALPDAIVARRWRPLEPESAPATQSGLGLCPTPKCAADFITGFLRPSAGATTQSNASTETMVPAASSSVTSGGLTRARSSHIAQRFRALMTQAWKWIASKTTGVTNPATYGSSPRKPTSPTAAPFENCSSESTCLKRVYDIVNAGPRNCFTIKSDSGHLIAHNCGYLGSVGALISMSILDNVDMSDWPELVLPKANEVQLKKARRAQIKAFLEGEDFGVQPDIYRAAHVMVQLYREANEAVVKEGYRIDAVVQDAMHKPNTLFRAAKCDIWFNGHALIIQLPSGRRLFYWSPQMRPEDVVDAETGEITTRTVFWYKASRGKQWRWLKGWAGLWIENICQAGCNDVLRIGMDNVQKYCEREPRISAWLKTLPPSARTPLVLHVHDEPTCELPHGMLSYEKLEWLLTDDLASKYAWLRGLPLAASGWTGQRYRK